MNDEVNQSLTLTTNYRVDHCFNGHKNGNTFIAYSNPDIFLSVRREVGGKLNNKNKIHEFSMERSRSLIFNII